MKLKTYSIIKSAIVNGVQDRAYGSTDYSKEELVAEMGSAFLCGLSGIGETLIDNSAAYISNWLQALRNDKKLVIQAAGQAQKASDFIMGTKFESAPEIVATPVAVTSNEPVLI